MTTPRRAWRIALLGAESTGKTTLARALAQALSGPQQARVAWVPEWLRSWCEAAGRTPQRDEQAAILRQQQWQIEAAAASHDGVVADTTALMTAVYHRIVFEDRSLDAEAVAAHRQAIDLTLLTALDLPWVPDPMRDGPHVRAPVDDALRELLLAHRLPFAVIGGSGGRRLDQALAAVAGLLAQTPAAAEAPAAASAQAVEGRWMCLCCSHPPSEQRLFANRGLLHRV